ncbi:Cytochrome P450 [Phytophthora cinnamomi]|uniref:Cytochrome P450 n=1 Tax=Phytophthora cinnamomi TaxID=4785 RepID=UPI0035599252|nr:Cytochrome P450 [Phytophthora cinnamomi]
MMPSSLLNSRGLVAIPPGPLLGSTLALVVFWIMRHGRERRLTWTSTPLPPRGYRSLPSASTSQSPVRVGMTAEQPVEGSPAFYEWVFAMTSRFHGKPWLLHVPGRPDVMVVSSPGSFEDIQRTFATQFDKVDSDAEGLAHDVHGGAIAFVYSGQLRPSVNMQRQLAASVLNSAALRQQASVLVKEHVRSLVRVLEDAARLKTDSEPLDVAKLMRQFAMEVFVELGFGLQLGALRSRRGESSDLEKAVDDVQRRVVERSSRPAVAWKLERLLDVGSEAALSRSVDVVSRITLGAVDAKRKRSRGESAGDSPIGRDRVDMLDLLLGQKCSSKSSKDPEFLAEFVLGLVVAARDSMAHALTTCLQCLAHHPEEQEKLAHELKEAEDEGKDLQSVVNLEAVVKETLRLHPSRPFIRRRARLDTVLSDGTFVAAGTVVAMDLYSMARRENVWGQGSAQFRPQRWIDAVSGKLRPTSNYKFNAFLGGPRACLGADIAMAEMKSVLAEVISRIHFDAVEPRMLERTNGKHKTMAPDVPYNGAVRVVVRLRGPSPPGQYS